MLGNSAEPIAVIGIACRFPQADGPRAFWRLLSDGVDAVIDAPESRWPVATLAHYRHGAFVEGVDEFDAAFFGIDAAEAAAMDPQQRLMLELAWHALEDARIVPDSLRGEAVGVFAAAVADDYSRIAAALGIDSLTRHSYAGTHRAMLANRLSYLFGLQGPSLTVDTGQSSSLVAVHLACESLRRGESRVALAGGVNLNLLAETTLAISEFGALSPDGHCHVFDARANGYVRGEGGAVLALKPLTAAQTDGDHVHAVLLGGAVNNDGGGESLTAPTVAAQRAVIESAGAQAGLAADAIGYVELHGTGTRIGDPIEAVALGAALGGRRTQPLLVGSVKTNIGHLEGAAGIAGLVKAVLAVEHGALPATVGYEIPNPDIALTELNLEVVTTQREWDGPRVAGVSSFGMGGTNCHLIVGAAETSSEPASAPALPWLLSARSITALRHQARALNAELERGAAASTLPLALARSRARLSERAVLLGADPRPALAALAEGRPHADVVAGRVVDGGTVFAFPGQGSQWVGMAAHLLAESSAFADRVAQCAAALEPFVDYSPLDVLLGTPGAADFERVDVLQPALWAVMVALADLWRAAGVHPSAVIGHSQGEIAAATAIGALSLADGARVVALRSRAIAGIAGTGGMLSIGAGVDIVEQAIAEFASDAHIAAVNGPRSTVASGSSADLAELQGRLTVAGYRAKLVAVDYASHSPAVEQLREQLLRELGPVRPRAVTTTFLSTVTGRAMETVDLDAEYWYRGLRESVRFGPAVADALANGHRLFVECSPHPIVATSIEETIEDAGIAAVVVGTLRRGHGDLAQLDRAYAQAHVAGAPVDWDTVTGTHVRTTPARLAPLPVYPFDRTRHWLGKQFRPTIAAVVRSADEVLELVRQTVADVINRADIRTASVDTSFNDLGVDSVSALEIRNRLRVAVGQTLPAGLLFDHPTPARLATHLAALDTLDAPTSVVDRPTVAPDGDDPIAIVALGCRYPGGVSTPEQLWQLVDDGVDAIGEFPRDRGWDLDALDPAAVRVGGFVAGAADFDAPFFGISPREAAAMDPQQRLMLIVCWEALERAGINPAALRGSSTGVFVGAMAPDYGPRLHEPAGTAEGHLLTGSALSVVSGRIAYTLGLEGPALTIDTACSSSLVALHLAARSLRQGECSLALAGGVTVMSSPGMFVEFSRQGGLSADGRCKAFSAHADGTAWSEGAGVVVLERLSAARAAGHPVLGLLRGSAINQDGRSNGLTAPSGPAQERVIRQALADAGLAPADISAVEAHGTGTPLGDPIEASALTATYGAEHDPEHPVWLGSLKSNIGHTQAAAGVAGVIKMVETLQHRVLPRTLHADDPTPHVEWASSGLQLLAEAITLTTSEPARVAVSGFGISGTNAHVVLEEAPPVPTGAADIVVKRHSDTVAWAFSATSAEALRAHAAQLRDHALTADVAAAARELAGRSVFDHRAVVIAADREELRAALFAVADGGIHPAATVGIATPGIRPVLVFPGQGSQWVGMAGALLEESESFWESMCRCDGALAPYIDWSTLDVLRQEPGAPALTGSEVIQPVLFAVMVSLAELWRSAGIDPAAVVGHSQGELAAACVSGVLTLDEAARLVALRSRALIDLDGSGGMLAVSTGAEQAQQLIEPWAGRLWVAVHNSPTASVVAGDLDALAEFQGAHGDRLQMKRMPVAYASHTQHVEQLADRISTIVADLVPHAAAVPFCSSVTGKFADGVDADYWYRGLRLPVLFTEAITELTANPAPVLLIEASPHPVLVTHIDDTMHDAGRPGAVIGTLKRGAGGWAQFLDSAAAAFVAGAALDWRAVLGAVPAGTTAIVVPTYPFRTRPYWLAPGSGSPDVHTAGLTPTGLRLPGAVLTLPGGDVIGTTRLSAGRAPWLADHAVGGSVLLPGTAFVEFAGATARAAGFDQLEDLTLETPLVVPEGSAVAVQVRITGDAVTIHARPADDPDTQWRQHASGRCSVATATAQPPLTWPPAGAQELDLGALYDTLAARGYDYGPSFRGLQRAWRTDAGSAVEVRLPSDVRGDAGGFLLHPALLDAALHLLVLDGTDGTDVLLPFAWSGVHITTTGADTLRVLIRPTGDDRVALAVHDGSGLPVATVADLTLRRSPRNTLTAASDTVIPMVVGWVEPAGTAADLTGRTWALVGDDYELENSLHDAGVGLEQHYDLASLADLSGDAPPELVVVPAPRVDDELPGAVRLGLRELLDTAVDFLGDDRLAHTRVAIVTKPGLADGAVWGFVRSAIAEHPGRLALVESADGSIDWARIAGALAAGENQLRMVDGQVRTPRLRAADSSVPAAWDPTGTVLITGGTGRLGTLLAQHLVTAHGVRHLLLVSRTGPAARDAAALVERIEALGATVDLVAADVSDRRAVTRLLAAIPAGRPLTAIVHAAGRLDDAPVIGLDPEQLDTVLGPKVDAAWHLHELTRGLPLTHFVLFSSVAGTLGTAGQANYAAANAVLDRIAEQRRADGLPAQSLVWGLWEPAAGMTSGLGPAELARLRRSGIGPLGDAEGLELFDAALAIDAAVVVVARLSLGSLDDGASSLLSTLRPAARPRTVAPPAIPATAAAPVAASAPKAGLTGLAPAVARNRIAELVQTAVAEVLGYDSVHDVDPSRAFTELGFDSLTVVDLRNRLDAATGLRLPATLAFDHSTVTALAEHLGDQLVPDGTSPENALRDALDLVADSAADDTALRNQVVALLHGALDRLGAGTSTTSLDVDDDAALFAFIDEN